MNVLELKVSLFRGASLGVIVLLPPYRFGACDDHCSTGPVVGFSDCRGQAGGMVVKPGTSDNNFPAGVRECIALYDWL